MGNTFTKKEETVETFDGGRFVPFGVYNAQPQDNVLRILRRLITERRIAPFYKGLTDYDENTFKPEPTSGSPPASQPPSSSAPKRSSLYSLMPPSSSSSFSSSSSSTTHGSPHGISRSNSFIAATSHRSPINKTDSQFGSTPITLADLYKGAVECPICFLYYPRNINTARCCEQPICTECFIQLKRSDSFNSPVACPFCVEPNFGVTYTPPRGLPQTEQLINKDVVGGKTPSTSAAENSDRPRRKSVSYTSPDVVTCDDIRPDYMRRYSHVRQAATTPNGRRASLPSRRLLLRQPGHPGQAERSRRVNPMIPTDFGYLAAVRGMGADLEELMVLEAVRLSLLESEQRSDQENQSTEAADVERRNTEDDDMARAILASVAANVQSPNNATSSSSESASESSRASATANYDPSVNGSDLRNAEVAFANMNLSEVDVSDDDDLPIIRSQSLRNSVDGAVAQSMSVPLSNLRSTTCSTVDVNISSPLTTATDDSQHCPTSPVDIAESVESSSAICLPLSVPDTSGDDISS